VSMCVLRWSAAVLVLQRRAQDAEGTQANARELLKELHACRRDVDARFADVRAQEAALAAGAAALGGLEATLAALAAAPSSRGSASGDGRTSLGGASLGAASAGAESRASAAENDPIGMLAELKTHLRAAPGSAHAGDLQVRTHPFCAPLRLLAATAEEALATPGAPHSTMRWFSQCGGGAVPARRAHSARVQAAQEKRATPVDARALHMHAERVSAELAAVHAQLREREIAVDDAQRRTASASAAAAQASDAARAERCALVALRGHALALRVLFPALHVYTRHATRKCASVLARLARLLTRARMPCSHPRQVEFGTFGALIGWSLSLALDVTLAVPPGRDIAYGAFSLRNGIC
jgi:hypothetical protein